MFLRKSGKVVLARRVKSSVGESNYVCSAQVVDGTVVAMSLQLTYTDPTITRFETKVGINKRICNERFFYCDDMDCRVRTYVVHTSSFFTLGLVVDLIISVFF